MVRIFVADGREHPDPDSNLTIEQVRDMMADFLPDLVQVLGAIHNIKGGMGGGVVLHRYPDHHTRGAETDEFATIGRVASVAQEAYDQLVPAE